jgi:hypothetical protein
MTYNEFAKYGAFSKAQKGIRLNEAVPATVGPDKRRHTTVKTGRFLKDERPASRPALYPQRFYLLGKR